MEVERVIKKCQNSFKQQYEFDSCVLLVLLRLWVLWLRVRGPLLRASLGLALPQFCRMVRPELMGSLNWNKSKFNGLNWAWCWQRKLKAHSLALLPSKEPWKQFHIWHFVFFSSKRTTPNCKKCSWLTNSGSVSARDWWLNQNAFSNEGR